MPSQPSVHVSPFVNWFWLLYCMKQRVFAWLCWFCVTCFCILPFHVVIVTYLAAKTKSFNAYFAIGRLMASSDYKITSGCLRRNTGFSLSPMQDEMFSSRINTVAYFFVSWAKTDSRTLMFNSAIVFDERFCLDYDPQGATSVANLAYMLYLWKKVGWDTKCHVYMGHTVSKNI